MNTELNLKETSELLLTLDPDADYSGEELDHFNDLAENLIRQYTWSVVWQEWSDYLYNHCPSDEDVVRFAHNFFDYASDRPVPEPLRFIAYFYYRVDVTKNSDAFDIFDSLSITVLPNRGLVNLMKEPNYAAESDPRIQAEIANWKRQQKE